MATRSLPHPHGTILSEEEAWQMEHAVAKRRLEGEQKEMTWTTAWYRSTSRMIIGGWSAPP